MLSEYYVMCDANCRSLHPLHKDIILDHAGSGLKRLLRM